MSIEKIVFESLAVKKINLSEIRFVRQIGFGGYGEVYYADWSGIPVAVKKLKAVSSNIHQNFHREIHLMAICQSPHIVELYGVSLDNGYSIVMEYLPKGSLFDVLHNPNEKLPWYPVRWEIASDIGKGLYYLHNSNIVHCDLRSPNVLLNRDYHAKIADLGLSNFENQINKIFGCSRWTAPEILTREVMPNKATDVYAYGVVLWEIASRRVPYSDIDGKDRLNDQIKNGIKEKIPENCPEYYSQLIQMCWRNRAHRPAMEQVLKSFGAAVRFVNEQEGNLSAGISDLEEYLAKTQNGELQEIRDLQLAAKQGDAQAQFSLGICYQHSIRGVNRDPILAVKYYQLSANQGFSEAQSNLGACYVNGFGVKKNLAQAAKYFQLAADQGSAAGQFNLGLCYEWGMGVKKELVHAVKYYRLAVAQGDLNAKKNLNNLLRDYPELRYQDVIAFQPSVSFFSVPPNRANTSSSSSTTTQPFNYDQNQSYSFY